MCVYIYTHTHTVVRKFPLKGSIQGTSLAVQCLRHCVSTAGGEGSNPGQGTKILHAAQHDQRSLAFKRLDKIRVNTSEYHATQPALCEVTVMS